MDIFGTDIKSSFSFQNGDIELISGESNLAQSIINILNTDLGFYDWAYPNYGSNIFEVFGMTNNNNSLEYLKIEIEYAVKKNPRIKEVTCNCSKQDSKTVGVELNVLTIGSDEIVTLNLVISDDLRVKIDNTELNPLAVGDRV